MIFLSLVGFMVVVGLGVALIGKFARINEPASAVSGSPLRSAVRGSMFAYRDATPEQRRYAEAVARSRANQTAEENLRNAIYTAGSSSYKF